MRRSKFEQLVSQYLDGEISPSELCLLKNELRRNEERRNLFKQYTRLHAATCVAKLECLENLQCDSGSRLHFPALGTWFAGGAFALASCLTVAVYLGWYDRGVDGVAPPFALAGGIEPVQVLEVEEAPPAMQLAERVVLLPEWNEELVSLALLEQVLPLGEDEFPDMMDRLGRDRALFAGQDYNVQWQRPLRPLERHRTPIQVAQPQNVRFINGGR